VHGEPRLDAVARDGVGKKLGGEVLALLCGHHPPDDESAEESSLRCSTE
jgi:hypothetical protein